MKKTPLNRFVALVAAAGMALSAFAADSGAEEAPLRPVLSAYTLEAGGASCTETYLSPLHYSGVAFALTYERMQSMRFNPEKWVMRLDGRLSFDRTTNPAGNASMWGLDLDLGWAMTYRLRLPHSLTLLAGGATGIKGGASYSARNSNNPVAAKAAWTIDATASLIYNTRIGRVPLCLRYQAELPLTGIFFCPEYGELYYEIYLGNRRGLVHGAWPGNYFRLDNLLTADFRFGGTILRVGYRCDVFSSKTNNIVTRDITHTAVLGLVSEWISLGSRSRTALADAKIISALY